MNPAHQNDETFLELIGENRPKILKICRVYAWNRSDQDDLYQEILCQIWRGLPKLKEPSHANTWLYRVALNTAISHVRKDRAHRSRMVTGEEETMIDAPDTAASRDPDAEERLFIRSSRSIPRFTTLTPGCIHSAKRFR